MFDPKQSSPKPRGCLKHSMEETDHPTQLISVLVPCALFACCAANHYGIRTSRFTYLKVFGDGVDTELYDRKIDPNQKPISLKAPPMPLN